jgi:hypothetical protein
MVLAKKITNSVTDRAAKHQQETSQYLSQLDSHYRQDIEQRSRELKSVTEKLASLESVIAAVGRSFSVPRERAPTSNDHAPPAPAEQRKALLSFLPNVFPRHGSDSLLSFDDSRSATQRRTSAANGSRAGAGSSSSPSFSSSSEPRRAEAYARHAKIVGAARDAHPSLGRPHTSRRGSGALAKGYWQFSAGRSGRAQVSQVSRPRRRASRSTIGSQKSTP